MNYEETGYGSKGYLGACELRERVLRQLLGMVLRPQDVEGEDKQFHFIAFDEQDQVLGTVTFKPLTSDHAKLRQMAVAEHLQGKGVGTELVRFAEEEIAKKGFISIETSARQVAIGFYEKLGYRRQGDFYEEVGLPTIKMVKSL
jgi:GNAT superfamily N-acetyltransferase